MEKNINGTLVNKDNTIRGDDGTLYYIKDYETIFSNGAKPVDNAAIGTRVTFENTGNLVKKVIDVSPSRNVCTDCTDIVASYLTNEEFKPVFNKIKNRIESGLFFLGNPGVPWNCDFDEKFFNKASKVDFKNFYELSFNQILCKKCKSVIACNECERSPYVAGFSYLKYPNSEYLKK